MHAMFYGSKKLSSLDLSNFHFMKVNDIGYMFSGCSNLKYINLKSLIIQENTEYRELIDKKSNYMYR